MLTHVFLLFIAIRLDVAESQLGRVFETNNDPSVLKFGDISRNDYFRLLEVDGKFLIVGAANKFFNLTIDGLKNVSVEYEWPPGDTVLTDCRMKTSDEEDCKNYIRVLSRDERNGNLLVCGTNAFKPLCRVLKRKPARFNEPDSYETVLELSGTGLSPLDPKHNSTFYREDDFLYAATVADFSGTDSLIFRRNISRIEDKGIRTVRDDIKFLNRPQFAGSLSTSKYVYFFFREEAVEVEDERDGPTVYSRVARVCKNDQGGPRLFNKEWTTFVKARLNCSLPGNKQFYFDQIVSISNPAHRHAGKGEEGGVVYATFVSEYDFLSHSVICAFDIDDIDRLFENSAFYTKDKNRNVYIRKKKDDVSRKIGQCHKNSAELTEDEAILFRSHPLMVDSIPSIFSRAVGVFQGDDHYNQIAVVEKVVVDHGKSAYVDVLYVGTDRGNIIKMVNMNGTKTILKEDSILKVATYKVSDLPIRRLLIKDDRLIAVTDRIVYGLPLHFCSKSESCYECIASRDPHCAWNLKENRCVFNDQMTGKKFILYQDLIHANTSICPRPKVDEIGQLIEKLASPEPIRKPMDLDSNKVDLEIEECDCGDDEKTKSKKDLRHSCDCSKIKDPKKENNSFGHVSPVVSNETEEASFKFWPWIVVIIIIQAAIIVGLIVAVWMYRNRYVKRSKLSQSTGSSVINAYESTHTSTYPTNMGTLRHTESLKSPSRPPLSKTASAGDIHARLEGSSVTIPIYAQHTLR